MRSVDNFGDCDLYYFKENIICPIEFILHKKRFDRKVCLSSVLL